MPESHIFADSAACTVLIVCALSVAFMIRALIAFFSESRMVPRHEYVAFESSPKRRRASVTIAPALAGWTGRKGESIVDEMLAEETPMNGSSMHDAPEAFAARYSAQFTWDPATADSIRSRSV